MSLVKIGVIVNADADDCAHDDCIKPRLDGRKYCLLHEYEDEIQALIGEKYCVYFIRPKGSDAVKIGTTINIEQRLSDLQTANFMELEILATIQLGEQAERELHKILENKHIRGEWFKLDDELMKFIEIINSDPIAIYRKLKNRL